MHVHPDMKTVEILQRAAEATGRTVEDLATSAVEEEAMRWAQSNPEPKPDTEHVMKAGIEPHDLGDLHKPHPLHDAVEQGE